LDPSRADYVKAVPVGPATETVEVVPAGEPPAPASAGIRGVSADRDLDVRGLLAEGTAGAVVVVLAGSATDAETASRVAAPVDLRGADLAIVAVPVAAAGHPGGAGAAGRTEQEGKKDAGKKERAEEGKGKARHVEESFRRAGGQEPGRRPSGARRLGKNTPEGGGRQ
jgi:hypothetical protein